MRTSVGYARIVVEASVSAGQVCRGCRG
jgi:hypothetical protein